MRRLLILSFLLIIILSGVVPAASLSQKQVRRLISRLAGAQLPSDAIRVKKITETGSNAEATVEIETAFRLVQDKQGRWRVDEMRTGQDQWEEIAVIAGAANARVPDSGCKTTELSAARDNSNLSAKHARCLLASLLKVELPSDAVRIRDVSSLGLPFTSQPSALVVALIQADVRFSRDKSGWRALDWRTGNGDWVSVDQLVAAINDGKRKRAQADLTKLAGALENFRKHNGFYVVSDKQPVLVDHLSPRYIGEIIRLDPWHNPYQYQGQRDHFLLRSNGPDGKENTADDVVVASP